ncbi:hypothetical protein NUW54_g14165 [Trametes sanguinea]|uniref:Uncharacterized protein n=1 Tax=Trametes sanguinea TaxID=158606 RepID=A0ACC1ME54_9APHY|nr:hypothetical protein NUW54_g14165 [Trametes sanguinea]
MLSRSLRAAIFVRRRAVPSLSAARFSRTFATPSDNTPPTPTPDQKPKDEYKVPEDNKTPEDNKVPEETRQENKEVQGKEGEQKEQPLKGLEGFFQRYHQEKYKQESDLPGKQEGGQKESGRQEQSNNRRNRQQQAPGNNSFNPNQLALLATTAAIFFALSSSSYAPSKEITWQEFRTAFLDKGLVDSLTVINRSKVRIKLHSNATGTMYPTSPSGGGEYYFSIGSVEAFERKLDEAQNELGIPSHERIPVYYHEEVSSFNYLLSFGPTLLFAGIMIYLSRRAGGASGGGGGIFSVEFTVRLPGLFRGLQFWRVGKRNSGCFFHARLLCRNIAYARRSRSLAIFKLDFANALGDFLHLGGLLAHPARCFLAEGVVSRSSSSFVLNRRLRPI